MTRDFYNLIAADYDRMVGSPGRMAREIPSLIEMLRAVDAQRILDVGCASGSSAIALAREGFDVTAIDPSDAMIAQARRQPDLPRHISFHTSTLDQWAPNVTTPFDGLICLGHTLPHLLGGRSLRGVLGILEHIMRPGGLLVAQLINPRFIEAQRVWAPPIRAWERDGKRCTVLRQWVDLDDRLRLVMTRMEIGTGPTLALSWRHTMPKISGEELCKTLDVCGWEEIMLSADFSAKEFSAETSQSMLVTARRPVREGDPKPRRVPGAANASPPPEPTNQVGE